MQLIERDSEIAILDACLDRVCDGHGTVCLVEGDPGLGKSSLLRRTLGAASERGLQTLSAEGDPLESDAAWGLGLQLFGALLRDRDAGVLFEGAAGLARGLLERVETPKAGVGSDPFPLLHGLHWLTANLAERGPLVVAVDDLHAGDADSLRLLVYLSKRLTDLPVLLLAAARPLDPLSARAEPMLALAAAAAGNLIRLQPLSDRGVAELVRGLRGADDPEFAAAIAEASGRNPFYAVEICAEAEAERLDPRAPERVLTLTPATIRRTLLLRLGRFSDSARELALAVSVLGRSARRSTAAELARLDSDLAGAAIDCLVREHLLASPDPVQPDPELSFAHPVLREVVYADIEAGRRGSMHAAAAEILMRAGAGPDEIVSQLLVAPPIGELWARESLSRAATLALAGGSTDPAVRILRRALLEPEAADDPELLIELGRAEGLSGEPTALSRFERASELAGDPEQSLAALAGRAESLAWVAWNEEAVAAAADLLRQIPVGKGGSKEAQVVAGLMQARAVPGLAPTVVELLRRPRGVREEAESPVETIRLALLGADAALRGEREEAQARLADLSKLEQGPLLGLVTALIALVILDDYARVESIVRRARDRAAQQGNRLGLAALADTITYSYLKRGEVDRCIRQVEETMELSDGAWELQLTPARAARIICLLERGELGFAGAELEAIERLGEELDGTWGRPFALHARAMFELADGAPERAVVAARELGECCEQIEATSPDYVSWRSVLALALAATGDRDGALAAVSEELELARRIGSGRAEGVALATAGGIGNRIDQLLEAEPLLLAGRAELELARARFHRGRLLRRERRLKESREPLAAAAAAARDLGASVLAESAEAELRAAGGRPSERAKSGPAALTPSQARVAELAATGLTNRAIAEQLFVSLRTVETHLTQSYLALGISSRQGLADALAVPVEKGLDSGRRGPNGPSLPEP